MKICMQVNVIPLNRNLLCYNVIDKATSIMSKKYWNLYNHLFTLVLDSSYFTKLSQNTRKKLDKSTEIMKSLHYGQECDYETLMGTIPYLF